MLMGHLVSGSGAGRDSHPQLSLSSEGLGGKVTTSNCHSAVSSHPEHPGTGGDHIPARVEAPGPLQARASDHFTLSLLRRPPLLSLQGCPVVTTPETTQASSRVPWAPSLCWAMLGHPRLALCSLPRGRPVGHVYVFLESLKTLSPTLQTPRPSLPFLYSPTQPLSRHFPRAGFRKSARRAAAHPRVQVWFSGLLVLLPR